MRNVAPIVVLCLLPFAGCGGSGDDPADGARALRLDVRASTPDAFQATVRFPTPRFRAVEEEGETFTEVDLEGCRPGGPGDGMPGVPVLTRLLAVPQGARVVVTDVRPVVSSVHDLLLHPYQVQRGEFSPAWEGDEPVPPEAEDWVPPFAFDRVAYAGSMAYPPDPIHVSPVFVARDLSLVVLEIAAGRYVPASRELTLYESVEVDLEFVGGGSTFLRNGAGNPFETGSKTAIGAAWNRDVIETPSTWVPPGWSVYGEELLILTHPAYRDAAERLAAHKNGRGLLTSVVTVNDGGGLPAPDTKEEIKAFLDDRWDTAMIRYSYLLLLGDADDIEPWVLPRRYKDGDFPSDFPYATPHADALADELGADVHLGRIPVGSPTEADVVVDKIIQYESNPPKVLPGGTFYHRAAVASYFEPGEGDAPPYDENYRRSIEFSEAFRNRMGRNGFETERIYVAHGSLTGENAPRNFSNGSPLPAPLRPEDGYPWDGDADDILDAFHDGKVLFVHIDHGGTSGWAHPWFSTSNLPSLTNAELLPVVVSNNCSSGAFDKSYPGFAESILRLPGGGAVGVFAWTRNSNSGVGWSFVAGVIDSIFPDEWPDVGDDQSRLRLGDMLDHARYFIIRNHVGGDPTSHSYLVAWAYERMLALFGDPTLEIWIENPTDLPLFGDDLVAGPALEFVYPYAGAVLTVFEEGGEGPIPIGRGVAGADGSVRIEPVVDVGEVSDLTFFASAPGGVATEVEVESAP